MAQSQLMQEALVFVERINLLRFLENSQPRFRSNVDRNLCNKFDGSGAWELFPSSLPLATSRLATSCHEP